VNAKPAPTTRFLDRPRAQDLPGASLGKHPRRDVHGDAADDVLAALGPQQLAFPGVQADPDLQPQVPEPGPDGVGGPDRAGRPVEGGQEPVAGRLDLTASEPREIPPHQVLVAFKEAVPAAVASTRSGSAAGMSPVRNSWVVAQPLAHDQPGERRQALKEPGECRVVPYQGQAGRDPNRKTRSSSPSPTT
jgi:hypothetical protein